MKSARGYTQTARADAAEDKTRRIRQAALELFVELPYDQLTLHAVAERAGVGLQTVIRRTGGKDGLVAMVAEWAGPQVAALLGEPDSDDPAVVAGAFARQYETWALVNERTYTQRESSPALAAYAEAGRRAHRDWVRSAFADRLAALPRARRTRVLARLVAVTGVELWLVLTAHEGLTAGQAEDTIAMLVRAALAAPDADRKQEP
jgi:AcrR family transcriptional regulator